MMIAPNDAYLATCKEAPALCDCRLCPAAFAPNWGIQWRPDPSILVVLESSDECALRTSYAEELFKTNTGRTLRRILGGFLDECLITNAAKCLFRGRKPSEREFRNCWGNLGKQIEVGDFRLVIGLGAYAHKALEGLGADFLAYPHPRRMTIVQKESLAREIRAALCPSARPLPRLSLASLPL